MLSNIFKMVGFLDTCYETSITFLTILNESAEIIAFVDSIDWMYLIQLTLSLTM